MKKHYFLMLFVAVCSAIGFVSCGPDDEKPEPVSSLAFSNSSVELGFGSGEELEVSVTSSVAWNITRVPSFISVSPTSGKEGTTTIRIRTTSENPSSESREESVTIEYAGTQAYLTVKQQGKPESKVYTKLKNVLRMCNGIAFDYEMGRDVKYFYMNLFDEYDYSRMPKAEIIKKVDTGELDDRENDPENGTAWRNLKESSLYYVVTVSYGEDGVQGETVITPIYTKSSASQPEATISNFRLDVDDVQQKFFYKWDVKRNNYCKSYYSYAAAYDNVFKTMAWIVSGQELYSPILLAWAIKREINRNKNSHSTNINTENDSSIDGREEYYGEQVNDGTSQLRADPIFDLFAMVMTWGTDASGELSGVINAGYVPLQSSSSSYAPFYLKANSSGAGEPERVDFNTNEILVKEIK